MSHAQMTEQHSPYPHADKAESDHADGDDKTDQDGLFLCVTDIAGHHGCVR